MRLIPLLGSRVEAPQLALGLVLVVRSRVVRV